MIRTSKYYTFSPTAASALENNFAGVALDVIFKSFFEQRKEDARASTQRRSKTICFDAPSLQPQAFEYVRTIFDLPHPRLISTWTSSVFCEPGRIVCWYFQSSKNTALEYLINKQCALMFDGMAIRQDTSSYYRCDGKMVEWHDLPQNII